MSEYILQFQDVEGAWRLSAASYRVANMTVAEAWELADRRMASTNMPYRVVTEKIVSTPVILEVPRSKPDWEVGKVYQHKNTGYVTDFHVEVVSEDGTEAQGWLLHRVDGSLRVEIRSDRQNFTEA